MFKICLDQQGNIIKYCVNKFIERTMTLRIQKKRYSNSQHSANDSQISGFGLKQIEKLVKPDIDLWLHNKCNCMVCYEQKKPINQQPEQIKKFKESSQKSHEWLKKLLIGLTQKGGRSLRLFVPDILFITGDGLQIFSTNKKDYRVIKLAGTTPIKALYSTMTRLRKQYKGMLQENFRKTMIDTIDPRFMHKKYYQKLVPSHFHDGDDSKTLNSNKSKFKSYILHKNQKYIINSIEEHKMNEKQPFCTIRFLKGNWQLCNQKQFQILTLGKMPDDISYIQSFIKSKQESQAIYYSSYTEGSAQIDQQLYKKAQIQVMVLLDGLSKYDEDYDELQNFQDDCDELMKSDPNKYCQLMTYKIIHYLSMASDIYIRHIKAKWVLNDIENIYLQQIIQFETNQVSKRSIRYKLPPNAEIKNFYLDSAFFVQVYKQMKKSKQQKVLQAKTQLQNFTYQEILQKRKQKNENASVQINPENSSPFLTLNTQSKIKTPKKFSLVGNQKKGRYNQSNQKSTLFTNSARQTLNQKTKRSQSNKNEIENTIFSQRKMNQINPNDTIKRRYLIRSSLDGKIQKSFRYSSLNQADDKKLKEYRQKHKMKNSFGMQIIKPRSTLLKFSDKKYETIHLEDGFKDQINKKKVFNIKATIS